MEKGVKGLGADKLAPEVERITFVGIGMQYAPLAAYPC
jgi:hypothetical protein